MLPALKQGKEAADKNALLVLKATAREGERCVPPHRSCGEQKLYFETLRLLGEWSKILVPMVAMPTPSGNSVMMQGN